MGTRYSVRFGIDYPIGGSATGTLVRAPTSHADFPYPRTVGGVTLGPTASTIGGGNSPGWVTGDDERLRGVWARSNDLGAQPYRIDLPDGPGDYRVWVLFPFASFSNYALRILDGVGGAERWYREFNDNVMSASTQCVINDETSGREIDTDVLDPEPPPLVRTFSTGVMEVLNGGHSAGNFFARVSAIVFEKIDVGPEIVGISPAVGRAIGTEITITVDDSTGCTGADVDGDPLTGFAIASPTTVRGTTDGAATGPVGVTNASGRAEGPTFTVVPIADAFRLVGTAPWAPAAGPTLGVPYSLTIEAINTAADARDTLFAGAVTLSAEMVSGDDLVIESGAGPVTFAAGVGTFSDVIFDAAPVTPPTPTITAIAPTSGVVGATITVTGTGLTGATAATVGGVATTPTVVNATTVTFTVPAGAATGPVTITTPGGTATGPTFTVLPPAPTITSVTPTSGPMGTIITVTGTNLTGATATVGGVAAAVTVVSATTVTLPATASGPVVLTTPGGSVTGAAFTVVTPPEPDTIAAIPLTRVDPWDRGADLVVTIRAAELVDESDMPVARDRVDSIVAIVADADPTTPAVALPGRAPVALTYDTARRWWRAVLPWGADLADLTTVRLLVVATVDAQPTRILESAARFRTATGQEP